MSLELRQRSDCPWEAQTLRGFSAWRQGRCDEAATTWTAALDRTAEFNDADARKAAALNNAALGAVIEGRSSEAAILLAAASHQWSRARHALATDARPLTGRGSAFHIQLASRNAGAFSERHRQDLQLLCNAGSALTAFNTYCVSSLPRRPKACTDVEDWIAAVASAFGPQLPEVRAMRALMPSLPPGHESGQASQPLTGRWQAAAESTRRDRSGIPAAAHLTAVVDMNSGLFPQGEHA